MNYLYHMVPKDMDGSILYPLNILKNNKPELFNKNIEKYKNREFVQNMVIPTLNCLWNDVLHLSPVHPNIIKKTLVEAGMSVPELKFFQIEPDRLDPNITTVYLNSQNNKENAMSTENFTKYDPNEIIKYSDMTETARNYYKTKIANGEVPLLFRGIPHILYRGQIDTALLPIITV